MQTTTANPADYIAALPEEQKLAMTSLRNTILENLPEGFEEVVSGGMISYVVPHALYPAGYHCNPKQALPFLSLASQKNYIALYHMGLYADPALLDWFKEAYSQHGKTKLDMGKSCIRFKKAGYIPFALNDELASKISPQEWIARYESELRK